MFLNTAFSFLGIVKSTNFIKLLTLFPLILQLHKSFQNLLLLTLWLILIFWLIQTKNQKENLRNNLIYFKKYFIFFFVWFMVLSAMFILWGSEGSGDSISFPASRYYYLPSAGICVLLTILFWNLCQAKNKFLLFLSTLFLLFFINVNFINFYVTSRGYKKSAQNTLAFFKLIETPIKDFSSNNQLYLINFPAGYKQYYYFYLNAYLHLKHPTLPSIFWINTKELNKISYSQCKKYKCFFLIFYNKFILDITKNIYQKNILK